MIEAKSLAKEQRIVLRNDLLLYGKAMIYITPEETVRQSVILYLTDTLHIPMQEIISEQHLSHYGITSQKRADIVIHALDTRVKMPTGKYGLFKLIEDYDMRMLSYGNASGGKFYGPYRSFLVKVDENTEFFSIGVAITFTTGQKKLFCMR